MYYYWVDRTDMSLCEPFSIRLNCNTAN